MDITPVISKERYLITSYGGGGFGINGEMKKGSLLVFADRVMQWQVKSFQEISVATLGNLDGIELLLIGSGATAGSLDSGIRRNLKERGIAVEVMDTGAACRTYNILLAEERRVVAALIAV